MYYRCQLVFELNRMVQIYDKNYRFNILKKSLEKIEDENKGQIIYTIINTLNNVCKVFYDLCSDFNEKQKKSMIDNFFEQYLTYLQKYSYFIGDVISMFKSEYRKNFQEQIFKHWNEIGKEQYEKQEKNFIEVFDDMHENCISKYKEIFVIKLGELRNLYRSQRGRHFNNYERMIPEEEFVRDKNRWNPEGVAFMYLGYDDEIKQFDETINNIEKTCFEELRLKEGEEVSVCKFKPVNKEAQIINLCYEDISYDEIESKSEAFTNSIIQIKVDEILANKKYNEKIDRSRNTDEAIKQIIKKEINEKQLKALITKETEAFLGSIIMKGIDEAVFLPVDKEDDPELKTYIPFHYLTEYLRGKGYAGIVYRSTRMNKIGLKGKNLVSFNKEDASYVPGSMKVYYYDGKIYNELNEEV